ncbi:MAG: DNA recombination protein RmuC [Saprospiraceae bacterium]
MDEIIGGGLLIIFLFQLIILFRSFRSNIQPIIQAVRKEMQEELRSNRLELNAALKDNRMELSHSMKEFREEFSNKVNEFNRLQKEKFVDMSVRQDLLIKTTETKLERMRETVDEKLHKTLEERLGQSFKIVSERLEAVQKGLGEMQHLVNDVGDLKKVLSNVKTQGVLGEIQLSQILEEIMAPEQYVVNFKTKQNSSDFVEFALKLPGKEQVYLPIDAKFPQAPYVELLDAYEANDKSLIDIAIKTLTQRIKRFAKDIHDKYLDPPYTTDFGILFLPFEGLYAEIARNPDLLAILQRDYKIIVAGPTTLAAMLNSLQMGFKTLAIQKRTSEVWKILGSVKTEFGKFGAVLDKAQKKLQEANTELDELVGRRTRVMLGKLNQIEQGTLPEENQSKG